MRIASICKSLHVLPRAGGVLDQPAREVRVLEAIFQAYHKWEKREEGRRQTRQKNRTRHRPDAGKTLQDELRGH